MTKYTGHELATKAGKLWQVADKANKSATEVATIAVITLVHEGKVLVLPTEEKENSKTKVTPESFKLRDYIFDRNAVDKDKNGKSVPRYSQAQRTKINKVLADMFGIDDEDIPAFKTRMSKVFDTVHMIINRCEKSNIDLTNAYQLELKGNNAKVMWAASVITDDSESIPEKHKNDYTSSSMNALITQARMVKEKPQNDNAQSCSIATDKKTSSTPATKTNGIPAPISLKQAATVIKGVISRHNNGVEKLTKEEKDILISLKAALDMFQCPELAIAEMVKKAS